MDDESKGFWKNMAKMLCAVALGMVPFLTLMIDDEWIIICRHCACVIVRRELRGKEQQSKVACRNLLELREDKGIPLVPVPHRLLPLVKAKA
jgi:hypothetical protein